jgi:hypothetical protein
MFRLFPVPPLLIGAQRWRFSPTVDQEASQASLK